MKLPNVAGAELPKPEAALCRWVCVPYAVVSTDKPASKQLLGDTKHVSLWEQTAPFQWGFTGPGSAFTYQ